MGAAGAAAPRAGESVSAGRRQAAPCRAGLRGYDLAAGRDPRGHRGATAPADPSAAAGLCLDKGCDYASTPPPCSVAPLVSSATGASGGDGWNGITSSPAPYSGTKAHQSRGVNEHWFNTTRAPLAIATGDTLFTYGWIDSKKLPQEIIVTCKTAAGDHCAYWGADRIATSNRTPVTGMKFSLSHGSATWNCAGKVSK